MYFGPQIGPKPDATAASLLSYIQFLSALVMIMSAPVISVQWTKRCNKFETKYGASDNFLCKILAHK